MARAKYIGPLAPVVWVAPFNVGSERTDEEHRKLTVDINELTNLLFEGGAWASIVAKSEELNRDAVAHFASEEKVLEQARYPQLRQHRAEHRRLTQQLADIIGHLAEVTRPSRTDIEATLYLRSMLLDHFFRKDIPYKSHLMTSRGA